MAADERKTPEQWAEERTRRQRVVWRRRHIDKLSSHDLASAWDQIEIDILREAMAQERDAGRREGAWAAGLAHAEGAIGSGPYLESELDEVERFWPERAADPLHPNGRCRCAGEGRCNWCLRMAEADGDGDGDGDGDLGDGRGDGQRFCIGCGERMFVGEPEPYQARCPGCGRVEVM